MEGARAGNIIDAIKNARNIKLTRIIAILSWVIVRGIIVFTTAKLYQAEVRFVPRRARVYVRKRRENRLVGDVISPNAARRGGVAEAEAAGCERE